VFSNDGKKLIGTKATIEFAYYEDPGGDNGEAVNSILIGNISWKKDSKTRGKYKTARDAFNAGDIRGLSDYAKTIIAPNWERNPDYLVAPKLFKVTKGYFPAKGTEHFRGDRGFTSIWQMDKDDDEGGFTCLGS